MRRVLPDLFRERLYAGAAGAVTAGATVANPVGHSAELDYTGPELAHSAELDYQGGSNEMV